MKPLNQVLREIMKAHGLSQSEAGRRADIHPSLISRILAGSTDNITPETLGKLLNVTSDQSERERLLTSYITSQLIAAGEDPADYHFRREDGNQTLEELSRSPSDLLDDLSAISNEIRRGDSNLREVTRWIASKIRKKSQLPTCLTAAEDPATFGNTPPPPLTSIEGTDKPQPKIYVRKKRQYEPRREENQPTG